MPSSDFQVVENGDARSIGFHHNNQGDTMPGGNLRTTVVLLSQRVWCYHSMLADKSRSDKSRSHIRKHAFLPFFLFLGTVRKCQELVLEESESISAVCPPSLRGEDSQFKRSSVDLAPM